MVVFELMDAGLVVGGWWLVVGGGYWLSVQLIMRCFFLLMENGSQLKANGYWLGL